MPDISKCPGTGCDKRNTCYRFTAKPSEYWQSYFGVPPVDKDGVCSEYWWDGELTKKSTRGRDE